MLPDTITSLCCLNHNPSALGRDYTHPSNWYVSFNVRCPKRRLSETWKLKTTCAHVALSRSNVNLSGNKTTVWVLGWHTASQVTFLHNSCLIKRDALHLYVPLTFFYLLLLWFFLRTDFLREFLMFRAFYPDILDNNVTTQVLLLLFCWKLNKAEDLIDNGHIF